MLYSIQIHMEVEFTHIVSDYTKNTLIYIIKYKIKYK